MHNYYVCLRPFIHNYNCFQTGDGIAEIGIGTPGRYFSRGGFAYYRNVSNMSLSSGFRKTFVNPSIGPSDVLANRGYNNTPVDVGNVGYYG